MNDGKFIGTLLALCFVIITVSGCFSSSAALTREGARLVDRERDWEGGRTLFQQAIERDDTNAMAHKNLALVFMHENELDKARIHLERAVELDPEYGEAHINLSIVCYHQEDFSPAVHHMDMAIRAGFPVDLRYRELVNHHR